jgi:tetratricopeptide (TPR) repeat protein
VKEICICIWEIGKLTLIAVLALSLAACELLGTQKTAEPVETTVAQETDETPPSLPQPPDTLSPSQRVRQALQQSQQGDYESARNQLIWALQEKPNIKIASDLLEQMDADPVDYLGLKNFYYHIQYGDTLSMIAKRFLDDPLKFVILARYNNLDNPSRLAPGQRIRIPGEMPQDLDQKTPQTIALQAPDSSLTTITENKDKLQEILPVEHDGIASTHSEEDSAQTQQEIEQIAINSEVPDISDTIDTAQKLYGAQNLSGAIALLENESVHYPEKKDINALLGKYYREYADDLIEQNNLENARSILEKLIILDSSDENAISQLIIVEDKLEAQRLFQQADMLHNSGNLESAYKTYSQGLTYDPDNNNAITAQSTIRDKLTDSYHRQAMQLFRKQELDLAIEFWDKILEMDPDHPIVPGYKARALEMKHQLEKL